MWNRPPAAPGHGALAFAADGSFAYTPAAGSSGTDTFTYTVGAGRGGSSTAAGALTVGFPMSRGRALPRESAVVAAVGWRGGPAAGGCLRRRSFGPRRVEANRPRPQGRRRRGEGVPAYQ